jgi:hypothetical protein
LCQQARQPSILPGLGGINLLKLVTKHTKSRVV